MTSITITGAASTMAAGTSKHLAVTVEPKGASADVTWGFEGDHAGATISPEGLLQVTQKGSITVTATSKVSGSVVGRVTIEVTEGGETTIAVSSIKLNLTSITIFVGGSEHLIATVEPANATNSKVVRRSSNEAIATVDQQGKVKGLKAGEDTITVMKIKAMKIHVM